MQATPHHSTGSVGLLPAVTSRHHLLPTSAPCRAQFWADVLGAIESGRVHSLPIAQFYLACNALLTAMQFAWGLKLVRGWIKATTPAGDAPPRSPATPSGSPASASPGASARAGAAGMRKASPYRVQERVARARAQLAKASNSDLPLQ